MEGTYLVYTRICCTVAALLYVSLYDTKYSYSCNTGEVLRFADFCMPSNLHIRFVGRAVFTHYKALEIPHAHTHPHRTSTSLGRLCHVFLCFMP